MISKTFSMAYARHNRGQGNDKRGDAKRRKSGRGRRLKLVRIQLSISKQNATTPGTKARVRRRTKIEREKRKTTKAGKQVQEKLRLETGRIGTRDDVPIGRIGRVTHRLSGPRSDTKRRERMRKQCRTARLRNAAKTKEDQGKRMHGQRQLSERNDSGKGKKKRFTGGDTAVSRLNSSYSDTCDPGNKLPSAASILDRNSSSLFFLTYTFCRNDLILSHSQPNSELSTLTDVLVSGP